MKSEIPEKITRLGASIIFFAAFLFGLAAVVADSFHTNLQQFLG